MKLSKFMPIATALVLAACGAQDKKGSDKAQDKPAQAEQQNATTQTAAQDEQAPAAFIVKVPVDANGNGSVLMMSQNDTSDGWRTLPVTAWTVFFSRTSTANRFLRC